MSRSEIEKAAEMEKSKAVRTPVSYTHLDVYKRQLLYWPA